MDNDLEKFVKQLQHMDVELPVHQQTLRKQLLVLHASRGRVSRQRPFYAHSRMGTIMTAKKILPVGVVVMLVGVLILGWFVLSQGSGGSPDRRRLAGQKALQDARIGELTGTSSANRSKNAATKPNGPSKNKGAAASQVALQTAMGTTSPGVLQPAMSNIGTTADIPGGQAAQNPIQAEGDIVTVVPVSTKAEKAVARAEEKAEKILAKAEAKAEKIAEKAEAKAEKILEKALRQATRQE